MASLAKSYQGLTSSILKRQFACIISNKRSIILEANPRVALHDVPCKIAASDLPPVSPVTFRAEAVNEKGRVVSILIIICLINL